MLNGLLVSAVCPAKSATALGRQDGTHKAFPALCPNPGRWKTPYFKPDLCRLRIFPLYFEIIILCYVGNADYQHTHPAARAMHDHGRNMNQRPLSNFLLDAIQTNHAFRSEGAHV